MLWPKKSRGRKWTSLPRLKQRQMKTKSQNSDFVKSSAPSVLPFGKYKGQCIVEVAARDPDYAEHLLDLVSKLKSDLRAAVWWRNEGWEEVE